MKNLLITIAFAIIGTTVHAQEFSTIDKSPMDRSYFPPKASHRFFKKEEAIIKALEPQIRITYSRPFKKGRNIFGGLLKFGKPWRVGANESTEILFVKDVSFGGKKIKAGRYSLIIVPTKTEWTLKLNTVLDGWGSYGYKADKDIASLSVPLKASKEVIENLSITLYEVAEKTVHLKIGWDTTIAEFPIYLE